MIMMWTLLVVSFTFLQELTQAASPSLGCCITDCYERDNGNYQSCYGCEYFATCSGGKMVSVNPTISYWDRRPCGATGLVWDDNKKGCLWSSDTCDPDNGICNAECASNLPANFGQECDLCEIADYLIVLDGSGSISSTHFQASLVWLKDIILNNIPSTANIAALQFATSTDWIHTFGDTQSPRATINANIDATIQINSGTNIGAALSVGISALNGQSASEKVLILLTDGYSADDPCIANPIPSDINLYVVGLDGADPTAQVACLSPNDVITISSFNFDDVTDSLVQCNAICYDEPE